jgi:hypothetical protein
MAALAMLLPKITKAQMPDTNKIEGYLQYVMQPLNKTQIATGYLEEYGLPVAPMATYNGTLGESNYLEPNLWRLLYFQLFTGYCQTGTNPMATISTVNNTIQQNDSANLPTPIVVLIGQYNTVKSNAFSSNLLSYNNTTKQVNDVPGRTQSPYDTKKLFAATPVWQHSRTGTESFVFKPNMVWGNSSLTVTQMQVDFKNGEGFKNMQPNVPVNITYADTGYYAWTIKATLSDNSIVQCYAEYFVLYKQSGQQRYTAPNIVNPTWGTIAPTANHSGGSISIVYSNNQRTNTLRKPLIIVENMDANGIAPALQREAYTMRRFIDAINETNFNNYDFNQQLDDIAGYDLVFINFNNGVDFIERNAAVVTEAIIRVNANKVNDNRFGNIRQQNVVLGMGTGGLNARYALAQYTKANATTQNPNPAETRLLITHDAPHRGQNIALGLQHLSYMLGGFNYFNTTAATIFPERAQTLAYLQAPVNQQTLIYRSTSDDANTTNTFINSIYQPMVNYNAPYRFVPTSLGNECAAQLFTAGRRFMDFDQSVATGIKMKVAIGLGPFSINLFQVPLIELKYECKVYARSIPNQGVSQREISKLTTAFKLSLFGFIQVNKWGYDKTAYAPNTYLPVDGTPGSINTILDFKDLRNYQAAIGNTEFSYDQYIYSIQISAKPPITLKFYAFVKAEQNNSGIFTTQYTTLPVGSALDVAPFDAGTFTAKFVNGTNPSYPSPAGTYIAQESVVSQSLYNNVSMRFTARNARFLFKEMENQPNSENCSAECSNPYTLSGVNILCTGSTVYKISGFPRGAVVTWNAIPTNVVSLIPNGGEVTVQKIGNGSVTLSATFNACNQNGTFEKIIEVGEPSKPNIPSVNFDAQCGSFGEAYALNSGVITGHIWNFNYGQIIQNSDGAGSNYFYINPLVSSPATGQIYYNYLSVQTKNSCGISEPSDPAQLFVGPVPFNCSGGGGQQLRVSPNPTSGNAIVETSNNAEFTQIKIINRNGTVVKTIVVAKTKRATIVTSDLQPGFYRVQVYTTNNKWVSAGLLKL